MKCRYLLVAVTKLFEAMRTGKLCLQFRRDNGCSVVGLGSFSIRQGEKFPKKQKKNSKKTGRPDE